ncbi:MAG TPA: hypothetical protein DEP38_25910 [Cyanobacteria bacterium UBA9226]|nr:hypothetical protein [Cyanobacteria bacterium UBA9226]
MENPLGTFGKDYRNSFLSLLAIARVQQTVDNGQRTMDSGKLSTVHYQLSTINYQLLYSLKLLGELS